MLQQIKVEETMN